MSIGIGRAYSTRHMAATTENQPREARKVRPSASKYHLHVPRGPELRHLPTGYESLEEAKRAFEHTRGVARWGLVAAHPLESSEEPRFVLQARVHANGVEWKSLIPAPAEPAATPAAAPPAAPNAAAPAPTAARAKVTIDERRVVNLLTPRLGFFTAEEVVRHLSARFQSADLGDEQQRAELREFLRRGLLGYLDPSAADELAAKCAEIG